MVCKWAAAVWQGRRFVKLRPSRSQRKRITQSSIDEKLPLPLPLTLGDIFLITTRKVGQLHVLDGTVCWWRTFCNISAGAGKLLFGEQEEKREEKTLKCRDRSARVMQAACNWVTRNLPRLTCMTWAFKNMWQIPQMRDRKTKCRGGKKHRMNVDFVALVYNISCNLGLKKLLFLMYFSFQDYKVRVPTRGEGS